MAGHRTKEAVRAELERTRTRLELYLAREEEMLGKGVQIYTFGSRSLHRHETPLAAIQAEIERLKKRIRELEAELDGRSARRTLGVVPRDW